MKGENDLCQMKVLGKGDLGIGMIQMDRSYLMSLCFQQSRFIGKEGEIFRFIEGLLEPVVACNLGCQCVDQIITVHGFRDFVIPYPLQRIPYGCHRQGGSPFPGRIDDPLKIARVKTGSCSIMNDDEIFGAGSN